MAINWIDKHRRRIAKISVTASAVRNQVPKGSARGIRRFLKTIDLREYRAASERRFRVLLDRDTKRLQSRLRPKDIPWGTARKQLNIFLRNVAYNHYLRRHYRFRTVVRWLEVPLDSYVGRGLAGEPENQTRTTPLRWKTIKSLSPKSSAQFQELARRVARRMGTRPVHLDVLYFRAEQE